MKFSSAKRILSFVLCISTLMWIVPIIASGTNSDPELVIEKMSSEDLYDLIRTAENVPSGLLNKLELRDSDVPDYMRKTNISKTDAVLRLVEKEDSLASVKYLNRDGTVSEFLFSENVKYKKDGAVFDKTNKLEISRKSGLYYNPDNDVRTEFPLDYGKNNGVKLMFEDKTVEIVPRIEMEGGLRSIIENDDNGDYIVYKDVFSEGIDAEYHPTFSGMKENIILNRYQGINRFVNIIKTDGLTLDKNGVFYNNNGEAVAAIGELFIYDAKGNVGGGSIDIREIGSGEYEYTIIADDAFLKNEGTVYPVTIDPTYTSYLVTDLKGISIASNSTYVNTGANTLSVGKTSSSLPCNRTFIRSTTFKNMLINHSYSDLQSIYLFVDTTNIVTSGNSSYVKVSVCPVEENWSFSNTVSSTLYNNIGAQKGIGYLYSSKVYQYQYIDLKQLANYLFSSGSSTEKNNGFALRLYNESQEAGAAFYSCTYSISTLRPYILITYKSDTNAGNIIDTKGLYKVKNAANQNKYLVKTKTGTDTYQLTYTTDTLTETSTENKSPYMSFTKISDSVYALYFVSSKKENKRIFVTYRGESNGIVLTEASDVPGSSSYDLPYYSWYVIRDYITLRYTFISKFGDYYRLSISMNHYNSNDKWDFVKIGLDVPLIMQSTNYYCGPATVLQVLKFYGKEDNITDINGNVSGSYQQMLASTLKTTTNRTPYENMYNYLNDELTYKPSDNLNLPYDYDYYTRNTLIDEETLISYIKSSLLNNCPVMVRAQTDYFEYYNDAVQYHFICLVGYDKSCSLFITRDCNNDDNYFGEHTISCKELYDMISNESTRNIMCKEH